MNLTYKTEEFQNRFAKMYPEFDNEPNDLGKTEMSTKSVTFVVTENCNLACTYCYECAKTKRMMSKETAKDIIDALFDEEKMAGFLTTDKHKCIIIELFGGEPMLNIDVVDFICDYFVKVATELNHPWARNHMFSTTTNGVLFNTPKVQRWMKKHKHNLSITITIDGKKDLHDACRIFPDGTGSHAIVEASVKKAIKEYGMETTKVTISPENLIYLNDSIPYLYDLGLKSIHANVVFENVWKKEHGIEFYKQLRKLADYMLEDRKYKRLECSLFDSSIGEPMQPHENSNWCGGDASMLSFGVDGKIYPCVRFMNYSLAKQKEICMGDVYKGIERNKPQLIQLASITRRSQSTDECFNCKVASGCAWCTGYNYDEFGTPDKRATYICPMHKARVLANYYFWNKLYEMEGVDYKFNMNLSDEDIKYFGGDLI